MYFSALWIFSPVVNYAHGVRKLLWIIARKHSMDLIRKKHISEKIPPKCCKRMHDSCIFLQDSGIYWISCKIPRSILQEKFSPKDSCKKWMDLSKNVLTFKNLTSIALYCKILARNAFLLNWGSHFTAFSL